MYLWTNPAANVYHIPHGDYMHEDDCLDFVLGMAFP